jgi:hypothetical protein
MKPPQVDGGIGPFGLVGPKAEYQILKKQKGGINIKMCWQYNKRRGQNCSHSKS